MKKLVWLIVLVVIVLGAWFLMSGEKAAAPTETMQEQSTVPTELDGLGDANLDAELQAIDADIKAL